MKSEKRLYLLPAKVLAAALLVSSSASFAMDDVKLKCNGLGSMSRTIYPSFNEAIKSAVVDGRSFSNCQIDQLEIDCQIRRNDGKSIEGVNLNRVTGVLLYFSINTYRFQGRDEKSIQEFRWECSALPNSKF